ncbi:aldose 1-epimerase [Nocardia thailandica]|uniref:Aldose 1-epimerase n=1 Tax=Nocardia thailandica TaxID=257275 RepID=A0ABW6PRB1_9NOCA
MAYDDVRLRADGATVTVSPTDGGAIHSLTVDGTELLRQGPGHGSFVMAPWVNRLGYGTLAWGGHEYEFPIDAPPHAIHGTARHGIFEVLARDETQVVLRHRLTDPWPFPGTVTQHLSLGDGGLCLRMRITADDEPFPAAGGWHPWFLREVPPATGPLRLAFEAAWQEERGPDHLPTGVRVPPRPGPWDDTFGMPGGVRAVLTWPGFLELTVSSPERYAVIWTLPEESLSVEAQSGPPNGLNTAPRPVTPDDPLDVRVDWTWRRTG